MKKIFLVILASLLALPALAEPVSCGRTDENGTNVKWPLEPVDLDCNRGFQELALCIIHRSGVKLAGDSTSEFISADDGFSLYSVTRANHPAFPMIVQRTVVQVEEGVGIETLGCGYGDKAASEQLLLQYKKQDALIAKQVEEEKAKSGQ